MRILHSTLMIACCGIILLNCGQKPESTEKTSFTKADSLTEFYLALQDSLHHTWHMMINDDNQKIKTLRNLLHELKVTEPEAAEQYAAWGERIDQLSRLRYTQKSMANADVITEYDQASYTIINELIIEAESKPQFAYNTTLQILVEQIRAADERMLNYRQEYDSIVYTYNQFVEKNIKYLSETEEGVSIDKKPLFQMVSDE